MIVIIFRIITTKYPEEQHNSHVPRKKNDPEKWPLPFLNLEHSIYLLLE